MHCSIRRVHARGSGVPDRVVSCELEEGREDDASHDGMKEHYEVDDDDRAEEEKENAGADEPNGLATATTLHGRPLNG